MTDFLNIAREMARANHYAQPQDYQGEEGILYCGDCQSPREFYLGAEKTPCLCLCRTAQRDQEEQEIKQRKTMESMRAMQKTANMGARYLEASFQKCHIPQELQRNYHICQRYVQNFPKMLEENRGLLFYGEKGTGKTHAAACIANALIEQRVPVLMTSVVSLTQSMESFDVDDNAFIDKLNRAKLLILDDLGAERGTEFKQEKVSHLIDKRYSKKLPMIITTNKSLAELKAETDLTKARSYSRVLEICYPLGFAGVDWRMQKAKAVYAEMEDFWGGS